MHAAAIECLQGEPRAPTYVVLVDTRMIPSALCLSRWPSTEGLSPAAPAGAWKLRDGRLSEW